jgi:ADP-heptose:LPS heptosyltransferase
MFAKLYKKSEVRNILVVSLTNIGDIIAVCPSIDILLNDFPEAKLSVIVGPKGRTVFEGNPNIERVFVYDKHAPFKDKIQWFLALRRWNFDTVIDFRNTLLPFLLNVSVHTPPELFIPKNIHLIDKHLLRLKSVYDFPKKTVSRRAIVVSPKDREYVDTLLQGRIAPDDKFVLVAPVAADRNKTWLPQRFAEVCDGLIERYGLKIVMVGGGEDEAVMAGIQGSMKHSFIALAGKTNLVQVAELLNRSYFSLVHDSGIMHMASYMGRQTFALFGFTDPRLSGPWSANSGFIWKNQNCPKCANDKSREAHICMSNITSEDVLGSIHIEGDEVRFRTTTIA